MAIVYGANYGRPTLDLNFAGNKSLIDTISGQNLVTFTRSQTGREATYVGADGLIKYASANEPRFDHNPVTGECLGLLVEESRTNLLQNSEIFTNWTKAHVVPSGPLAVITPNVALAPDGKYTASSVFFTASSSYVNIIAHPAFYNLTTGVKYTFSVYLKVPSGTAAVPIGINEDNASPLNDVGVVCNLTTSWQRFSITTTKTNGNLASGNIGWYINTGLPLGPATDTEVHVWGAQFEEGSFPTSYIPTDGTAGGKTRSRDEASITGTNFSRWYNQSEGTVYVDRTQYTNSAGHSYYLSDSGLTANRFRLQITTHTGTNADASLFTLAASGNKSALAVKTNDVAVSADGSSVLSDTTFTLAPMDRLFIGKHPTVVSELNGHISRLTYYPKRLQNFQLQQLTK